MEEGTSSSPKVFISYSWTSQDHRDLIRSYAERLMSDGVDVILDQWDLTEGQDKYAFMESMVTDETVTNVLIFSDNQYAAKADARKEGVGTESQIISAKIYQSVKERKFVPVVCERADGGKPCLPTFLENRIFVDFSSPEKANENWEQLVRLIFGKPLLQKPKLGTLPSYLEGENAREALPMLGKLQGLKNALMEGKPSARAYRKDLIDSVLEYIDNCRVRNGVGAWSEDARITATLHNLLPVRDVIIDWLELDGEVSAEADFERILLGFLARLLNMKFRPDGVTAYRSEWFEGHEIFVYETFLYVIAVLIKLEHPKLVNTVFSEPFMIPEIARRDDSPLVGFEAFYTSSDTLRKKNDAANARRISPLGDLIKDRSTRSDIALDDVVQAELLVFLRALLSSTKFWYPHTSVYASYGRQYPLFALASAPKYFERLRIMLGAQSADAIREGFVAGVQRLNVSNWRDLTFWGDVHLEKLMNIERLATLNSQ